MAKTGGTNNRGNFSLAAGGLSSAKNILTNLNSKPPRLAHLHHHLSPKLYPPSYPLLESRKTLLVDRQTVSDDTYALQNLVQIINLFRSRQVTSESVAGFYLFSYTEYVLCTVRSDQIRQPTTTDLPAKDERYIYGEVTQPAYRETP